MPYIYDNRGNRIGEIYDSGDEAAAFVGVILALLVIAMTIAFWVVPYWASYEVGKGIWSRRSMLIKILGGFILSVWIGLWVLVAVSSLFEAKSIQGLPVGILALGSVALAYRIGKAQRKSERTTSKTSTTNRWLGR